MPDRSAHPSPASVRHAIVDQMVSLGVTEVDLAIVGSGGTPAAGPIAETARMLRERFQAMTNIGLSPPRMRARPPQRRDLPGCDGAPALSYLAAGDPAGQPVLFIHGTPGAAVDWAHFLGRVPAGQHRMAVDRPGFGQSGPGMPVTVLQDQARALAAVLGQGGRPAVVVGSSYGGPVALQLAVSHPESVSGVVLVGAAADPLREEVHPLQRLAALRGLRCLLPRDLSHSNAELLVLRDQLAALGEGLGRIRAPVTILQGLQDTLVPAENARYLVERLGRAARRRVVLVERAGHFLHILRSGLVEDALAELLSEIDKVPYRASNQTAQA